MKIISIDSQKIFFRISFFVFLMIFSGSIGCQAESEQIEYNDVATHDSYVQGNYPDQNYGNMSNLDLGHGFEGVAERMIFMKFNLTGIAPNATIVSAKLIIYEADDRRDSPPSDMTLQRVRQPWAENYITWSNKPDVVSGNVASVAMRANITNKYYYEWDLTDMVKKWRSGEYANYGLRLSCNSRTTIHARKFISSEGHEMAYFPKLKITYTLPRPAETRDLSDFINHINVDQITDNSARINYKTEEDSVSYVIYGTTRDDLSKMVIDMEENTTHHITLAGLEPDKRYYFGIAAETFGAETVSDTRHFNTLSLAAAHADERDSDAGVADALESNNTPLPTPTAPQVPQNLNEPPSSGGLEDITNIDQTSQPISSPTNTPLLPPKLEAKKTASFQETILATPIEIKIMILIFTILFLLLIHFIIKLIFKKYVIQSQPPKPLP